METALAFGRELQKERERRGVSLNDVAEGTKVSSRYLTALENNDLGSLPGGVFNKGFLRSYCRFLGLDETEWLARFSANSPGGAATSDAYWAEFAENVKRNRTRMEPRMRRRWWGVLLMACALVAAGWAMWHYLLRSRLELDGLRSHTSAPPPPAPAPAPEPVTGHLPRSGS